MNAAHALNWREEANSTPSEQAVAAEMSGDNDCGSELAEWRATVRATRCGGDRSAEPAKVAPRRGEEHRRDNILNRSHDREIGERRDGQAVEHSLELRKRADWRMIEQAAIDIPAKNLVYAASLKARRRVLMTGLADLPGSGEATAERTNRLVRRDGLVRNRPVGDRNVRPAEEGRAHDDRVLAGHHQKNDGCQVSSKYLT